MMQLYIHPQLFAQMVLKKYKYYNLTVSYKGSIEIISTNLNDEMVFKRLILQ